MAVILGAITIIILLGMAIYIFPIAGQFINDFQVSGQYSGEADGLKGMYSTFALMLGAMILSVVGSIAIYIYYGGGPSRPQPRRARRP